MHRFRPWIHALALAALTGLSAGVWAEPFTVTLNNNHSGGKTLYLAVYRADQGEWEALPTYAHKHTLPEKSALTLPLELAPGNYALRTFVDLDGDGELATGTMGKPLEPFASSIGTGRKHPSIHFDRSVITLSARAPSVTLTLRYPNGTDGGD